MRRTNAVQVVVEAPDRGLVTSVPSDLPDKARNRAIVVAKNVRAEYGVLRAAPGYERVLFNPRNLDSPANLIFQSNILNNDPEIRTTPIIGTSSKLFALLRRAKTLVCDANGNACSLTAAFIGDSGRVGPNLAAVADLVKSWSPDLIVHTGDLVYADGGESASINDYEEAIGQYFWEYLGGYNGIYGVGPARNKFFPVLGNHDWDDGGIDDYLDFFQLPLTPNERYYHYKRGPVHFIHLSGYGAEEPDGVTEDSVQGQWAQEVLENSDCPWRIVVVHFPPYTSDINYYPGIEALRWEFKGWGATAVVSGHSHNMELLQTDNLDYFVVGNSGHSLRGFHAPAVDASDWRYSDDYGALKLEATRTECVWKFYRKDGELLKTLVQPEGYAKPSSGICYIGDAGRSVAALEVVPANAAVEIGFSWPFEAFAHYTDGTVENVTLQSLWTSSDTSIAALQSSSGVATGISAGTIVVTAEFEGQTASANLTVLHSCLDAPMEVCFVVERSESMGSTASGMSRLQAVKEGLALAAAGFVEDRDYLALVSFGGTASVDDYTTDQVLTTNFDDFNDRVSILSPSGTGASIAKALEAAYDELTSVRHDSSRIRAVVLIVDVVRTNPASADPVLWAEVTAQADAIKGAGIKLTIVGRVPEAFRADFSALATEGYDWYVTTASEMKTTLSLLSNSFCMSEGYYYTYPPGEPTEDPDDPPTCFSAQPDYWDWLNWDVIAGSTDLCGQGENGAAFMDVLPGNGLYMDLAGTSGVSMGGTINGTIRSKETFNFTAGKTYRLTFYMAGWNVWGPPTGTFGVEVSIENVLSTQTVTISDRLQPFTLYTYEFTPETDQTGRIIFSQQTYAGSVGLLLDRVKLENVTDTETMIYDDFDAENPCEI